MSTRAGRDQTDKLADLLRQARELLPMTEEQRNEQRASFAYGNLALMREYRDASPEILEELRQMCRKAAGCLLLALLIGCAPCPCEHVPDAAPPPHVAQHLPPLEPDVQPPVSPSVCGRRELGVALPCRPFDRRIDTPDPQP